jgi:uncharacterized protein
VLEVDLPRKRIALTMRLGEPAERRAGEPGRERTERPERGAPRGQPPRQQDPSRRAGGDRRPAAPQRQPAEQPVPAGGALAAAFEKARKG